MRLDLKRMKQDDVGNFVHHLKENGIFKQSSVEGCCQSFAQNLCESAADSDSGALQLILSRVFVVLNYEDLTDELKAAVTQDKITNNPHEINYLVLLGTYGKEQAWRSRATSQGHRAIPLTEKTVLDVPMMSRCLQQVGFDLKIILSKERHEGLVLQGINKLYGVFYVPNANGSPYIPAQTHFVIPHKVVSVIGSGTCLPTGTPMIYIGFSVTSIPEESTAMFSPLMTCFGRELTLQFMNKRYFET